MTASAKDDSANGGPRVCGLGLIDGEELADFWFLAGHAFGEQFEGTPNFAVAKSDGLKRAFTLLHGLAQENLLGIVPSYDYAFSLVLDWQFNDNIHRTSDYPRQYWSRTTQYRVVAVPPLAAGSRPMPILNLYLAVKKSSPEKEAASWDFVRWATSPDVLAKEAVEKRGFLPIHESVASSAMFKDRVTKMPHLDVFVNTLRNIEPVFPFEEGGDKAFEVMAEAFLKAFAGEATIDDTLAGAQTGIDSVLAGNAGK
jgi:ABC-type glycerol-3-phosphate transport system substrate-binding protein